MDNETKRYFDQKFDKFEKRLDENLDQKLIHFATKEDLEHALATQSTELKEYTDEQTLKIKQYTDEQTEHLARIIETSVAEPLERVSRKLSSPFSRQF